MVTCNRLLVAFVAVAALSACGPKTLNRSQAAADLKAHFEKENQGMWLALADYRQDSKRFGCPFEGCPDAPYENWFGVSNGWNTLIKASKRGLVTFKLVGKTQPRTWDGYALFRVNLTDEGKKYVLEEQKQGEERKARIKLRELKNVEVMGIGAPSDMFGRRVSVVTYSVTYQPTPFEEALGGGRGGNQRKGEAHFVLYDNGWKLEEVH